MATTSAQTIYYTPYLSNVIALYDGSAWAPFTFSEASLSLSGLTTGQPYDIFGFLSSNVLTLEAVAWASNSARTTDLVRQNGVYVKTGTLTKRFLGSIQMQATGQCEDSKTRRFVFNQYNRLRRQLRAVDATTSWAYTVHTWRQANANAANQVSVLNGSLGTTVVNELEVHLVAVATSWNNVGAAAGAGRETGIGVDLTNAVHANCVYTSTSHGGGAQFPSPTLALLDHAPAIGKHDFTWLERAVATNTTTWFGSGTVGGINGLSGHVLI